MSNNKILIGIDPDVEASGVAYQKGDVIKLANLSFFKLFDELNYFKERENKPVVYVECGFLNKGNWHKQANGSAASNSQIGQRTGANHETAKKIVEMCEYLGLECVEIRPSTSKLKAEPFKKITGIKLRTNQEQRDAYMLIFGR